LHRRERHALRLVGDGFLFGPLRRCDAATEIDQCLFRHVDAKGADGGCVGVYGSTLRRGGFFWLCLARLCDRRTESTELCSRNGHSRNAQKAAALMVDFFRH
jgi:hypothetical protein